MCIGYSIKTDCSAAFLRNNFLLEYLLCIRYYEAIKLLIPINISSSVIIWKRDLHPQAELGPTILGVCMDFSCPWLSQALGTASVEGSHGRRALFLF